MKIPANFKYPGFYDLLCDALYQHTLASEITDSYKLNRHARSSIISSVLVLECCANSLILSLDIPKKLRDELDKLPLIAKFDSFLRLSNISSFDRGRNEVEKVFELIKLRNEFVHPKVVNIKTEIGQMQDQGEHVMVPMELTAEQWNSLNIPKRSLFWSADSSLKVLHSVAVFLNYLFVELLNMNKENIQLILMASVEFGETSIFNNFEEFRIELNNAVENGIDLSIFI
jgi:hypothetical protein